MLNLGGVMGGGRLNLSGAAPTEGVPSALLRTPAITQPTTSSGGSTSPAILPKINLPAPSKFAALIQPEITKTFDPNILTLRPNILTMVLDKTTTQLARGAIQQLKGIDISLRNTAINTVNARRINPASLMSHLERRVRIGEVLNEMADKWEEDTKQDFAEALNMEVDRLDLMDTIVSLAILNDPDLEDELRIENLSDPTEEDLLSDRRIVWQYPPPGTPLDPPYMVFVAVEHQEFTEAQEIIDSILGQLTTHEGFKVPKVGRQRRRRIRPGTPERPPIRPEAPERPAIRPEARERPAVRPEIRERRAIGSAIPERRAMSSRSIE